MTMNKRAKSNTIRIISGKWRGRRLPVLEHHGLLFNWLMHDISDARCLDLFAGSGALGLECLSRGAKSAVFVEANKAVSEQLQKNLKTLDALELGQIFQQDALSLLRRGAGQAFDLVFLDPPFDGELLPETIALLHEHAWLAEGALVYIEQASKGDLCPTPGWQIYRDGKTGHCRYTLYAV